MQLHPERQLAPPSGYFSFLKLNSFGPHVVRPSHSDKQPAINGAPLADRARLSLLLFYSLYRVCLLTLIGCDVNLSTLVVHDHGSSVPAKITQRPNRS